MTAVDLNTAERLVLGRGRVLDAVLASIAVPGVFPARNLDGRTLVDGGVMDPVPVGVARSLKPGLPVVAVVLSPPHRSMGLASASLACSARCPSEQVSFAVSFSQALNIFMRSIDIAGALLTELLLEMEKPDVLIRPAVQQIGLLDQVDVAEVARLGERAAEHALPELNRAVSWQARLERAMRPRRTPQVRPPYSSDFIECLMSTRPE